MKLIVFYQDRMRSNIYLEIMLELRMESQDYKYVGRMYMKWFDKKLSMNDKYIEERK